MAATVAVFCRNRCAGGGDGNRSRGGSQHSLLSDPAVPCEHGTLLVPDGISFLICIIEIAILYVRYSRPILERIEMSEVFNGAFLILCANIVLILFFMLGAFITNSILLNRDPYEDLRGTL